MIWQDGFIDGNSTQTKPRITIPRDPDLETANRAQRIRFFWSTPAAVLFLCCSRFIFAVEVDFTVMAFECLSWWLSFRAKSTKDEKVTSTVRRFKALPLNRKVSVHILSSDLVYLWIIVWYSDQKSCIFSDSWSTFIAPKEKHSSSTRFSSEFIW